MSLIYLGHTSEAVRFRNIAISGEIGTGTSTLAERLSLHLGWKRLNAGEFFRKWLEDNHYALEDAEKIPPEVDRQIDYEFQNEMQTAQNLIFESRLAGWWSRDMSHVGGILLVCDFEETVERVARRDGLSVDQARMKMQVRSAKLREKFQTLYGTSDFLHPQHFGLVIDTSRRFGDTAQNTAKALEFLKTPPK
jgi:predicted cytidylate kinase